MEMLEDRVVPATLGVDSVSGVLTFTAETNVANNLRIGLVPRVINNDTEYYYSFSDPAETITAYGFEGHNTDFVWVLADSIQSIVVNLGNRNDRLTLRATDVPVTVNGGTGDSDRLTIDDEGTTLSPDAARTYKITSTSVSRTGAALVSYNATVESLTVNAGDLTDTFHVQSTADVTPVTLNGGGGTNTTNIGSGLWSNLNNSVPSTLDDIEGAVTVNGQGNATDILYVNDQGPGTAQTYTIRDDLVRRSGVAAINHSGVDFLHVFAGDGADTLNVVSTAADVSTIVYAGRGSDILNMGGSGTGTLGNIRGSLNVYGDAVGPAAASGTDFDEVNFNDQTPGTAKTYTLKWNGVERSGAARIGYYLVEDMTLNTTDHADTIRLEGTPAETAHTINAGPGADDIVVGSSWGGLAYMLGDVTVNGQNGRDALVYSPLSASSRVVVNLALATPEATGLSALSSIEDAFGGAGDDLLVGDADANRLVGNGGRDLIIGGAGSDTIEGGAGMDLLIGGTTSYDTHEIALGLIHHDWRQATDYDLAIDALTNDPLTSFKLTADTVQDDGVIDSLWGGLNDGVAEPATAAEQDWLWANTGMDSLGDRITTGARAERVN
jgi:hypothetical protein